MTQNFIIRVEGTANSYGLGEEVAKNCTLFRKDHYNLTKDELDKLVMLKRSLKESAEGKAVYRGSFSQEAK